VEGKAAEDRKAKVQSKIAWRQAGE